MSGISKRDEYTFSAPDTPRVRYIDKETGKALTFLTNNMIVPSETVASL